MALDWDTLFKPQDIHKPTDQWPDLTPSSATPYASQMTKPTSNDILESTLDDASRFDSLLNESLADPLFSDSLFIPNEYFLSDLDNLPPFENFSGDELTVESSSEPLVDVDQYSTVLSNELDLSPQMLSASLQSSTQALTSTRDTAKRNKNKPDILSACWTSPLCPNRDQNGPPPDPSTCGGGCAPFLFATDDNLLTSLIPNQLVEPQEIMAEDGIVEVQPRHKRRSGGETSSTEKPPSRLNITNSPTEIKPRIKRDTPETTASPPALSDPPPPASRRRLPHNQVERKYRESLNTQLESLRRVVPSLQQSQPQCDTADMEDLQTPPKPSKAVILASATAYIKQVEKEKKKLAEENEVLKRKMKVLQKLVKCDECNLMQYVVDLKIRQDG